MEICKQQRAFFNIAGSHFAPITLFGQTFLMMAIFKQFVDRY